MKLKYDIKLITNDSTECWSSQGGEIRSEDAAVLYDILSKLLILITVKEDRLNKEQVNS